MFIMKRFLVVLVIIVSLPALAAAQSSNRNSTNTELSVEESYLQQTIEIMTIRETSRVENREMKMLALDYINDAISRGNTSDEIRETLQYLGEEGIINKARENGRLVNDYPDVRARAATYLGNIGTAAAKNALVRMLRFDRESMVLFEVIRSLDKIGINENDETVEAISFIFNSFDNTNPDNRMAMAALEYFENIAAKQGTISPSAIRTINKIMAGPYIRPVKERAYQVMENIKGTDGENSNSRSNARS